MTEVILLPSCPDILRVRKKEKTRNILLRLMERLLTLRKHTTRQTNLTKAKRRRNVPKPFLMKWKAFLQMRLSLKSLLKSKKHVPLEILYAEEKGYTER